MKLLIFITGALFASLSTLGILFRVMHYPAANALLIFGLAGISLFFIPSYVIYKYRMG